MLTEPGTWVALVFLLALVILVWAVLHLLHEREVMQSRLDGAREVIAKLLEQQRASNPRTSSLLSPPRKADSAELTFEGSKR